MEGEVTGSRSLEECATDTALKHRRLPPDPMLWSLHVLDCLIK